MRQDAVTRDRRYGPLMAKRSEGRKEGGGLSMGLVGHQFLHGCIEEKRFELFNHRYHDLHR